jgi:hypothetical protein
LEDHVGDILQQILREFPTAVAWLPTVIAGVFTLPASVKCVEWLREELQIRRLKRDAGKAAALELVPLTWAALPQKIAGTIRMLPNEIDDAQSDIKFEEYPGQRYESASRRYVLVGYRAVQLADELRYYYGQGRFKSTTEYNFQANLRRQYHRVYRGRLRHACDYVRYHRWASRLKRRLRRVGERISSITTPTGAA